MKKIKRLFLVILAVCLIIPVAVVASGCAWLDSIGQTNTVNSVERIAKTSSDGLVDTYTIYYTDGSTSQFQITNGAKGAAGQNGADGVVDIEALYEKYKEETGSEVTFEEFVDAFLNFEVAQDNSKTINECLLSAVKICCEFDVTTRISGTNKVTRIASRGSGVIYKMDENYTYILTNYHVMNYYPSSTARGETFIGSELEVCVGWLYGCGGSFEGNYDIAGNLTHLTYDGYEIAFEYVGGSLNADIAVLRVATDDVLARNTQAKAVECASSYYVGETAIAIGNPEDMGISVTEGIVSVDNEFVALSIGGVAQYYRSIRIDTSIYSGSSGGALFNKEGKLIGITNSGMSSDENVNWAIPIGIVSGVANNIIDQIEAGATEFVKVKKIIIGVTVEGQNSVNRYDPNTGYGKIVEDIVVKSVVEGSIAEGFGIVAGDIIKKIEIADVPFELNRYFEIGDALYTVKLGDVVKITYEHEGTEQVVEFTVNELVEQD